MAHVRELPEAEAKSVLDWPQNEAVAAEAVMAPPADDASRGAARRPRGRPLEMSREELVTRVRELAQGDGLFRVHRAAPALYARARRMFGSWAAALDAAGVDYRATVERARKRSVDARQQQRVRAGRPTGC